jgi:hypothetical protein
MIFHSHVWLLQRAVFINSVLVTSVVVLLDVAPESSWNPFEPSAAIGIIYGYPAFYRS